MYNFSKIFVLAFAQRSSAWWNGPHRIIATIAESILHDLNTVENPDTTLERINAYLGDLPGAPVNNRMADASIYADDVPLNPFFGHDTFIETENYQRNRHFTNNYVAVANSADIGIAAYVPNANEFGVLQSIQQLLLGLRGAILLNTDGMEA